MLIALATLILISSAATVYLLIIQFNIQREHWLETGKVRVMLEHWNERYVKSQITSRTENHAKH